MNFDDLMQEAKELLDLRPDGWIRDNFFNMAKLAEECGEVAECLAKSSKTLDDLGEELSDVIIVVAIIALKAGIDLNDAHTKKQNKRVDKILKRFHEGKYPEL